MQPWRVERFCIPEKDLPRFVAQMEDVLDVYSAPQDPDEPLVCDNLNTHHIASLYETFPAQEAHRLARKLEIHYTPRNGSWLNVAEIELSILSRQCLDRRIADAAALDGELAQWNLERNLTASRVNWRFTTADARIKLRRLYPTF